MIDLRVPYMLNNIDPTKFPNRRYLCLVYDPFGSKYKRFVIFLISKCLVEFRKILSDFGNQYKIE